MKRLSTFVSALLLLGCASGPADSSARELVFYPGPPAPPRMQFLRSVSGAADVTTVETSALDELLFGKRTEAPLEMTHPAAIAFRDGVFYVTDTTLPGIFAVDLARERVDVVPLPGRAVLSVPLGLCFDADGRAYVADRVRRQVVVLDRGFRWQSELGPWAEDSAPTDVAVWRDRLYVADSGARCVRVLALPGGEEIMRLGEKLERREYLRGPSNLTVDEDGYVYVVDTIFSTILVWDKDGRFVRQIGKPGNGPGCLMRPKGIAHLDDMLLVLDSAYENCQIFDLGSRFHGFFGGPGPGAGDMNMPRKVWAGHEGLELFADRLAPDFHADALIAVSNAYGNRLNFYAFGHSDRFRYPEITLPRQPPPEPTAGRNAKEAMVERRP